MDDSIRESKCFLDIILNVQKHMSHTNGMLCGQATYDAFPKIVTNALGHKTCRVIEKMYYEHQEFELNGVKVLKKLAKDHGAFYTIIDLP